MRLKYLGTGASEGWPAIFCECESCRKAAEKGGRNIRTRSQAVVDDRLLIDFPPDTYMHVLYQGLDLSKIKHCIITHRHSDHLYAVELVNRQAGFVHFKTEPLMTFYGTGPTGETIMKVIEWCNLDKDGRAAFKLITPFEPFDVEGYRITPLKANHDPGCEPVIFAISDGKKQILYGNDTGYFPEETWEALKEFKLDGVILDCTSGGINQDKGHMGIEADARVKERLIKQGSADENTIFIVTHFSHNVGPLYDDMVQLAEKYNFIVAYDGMTIEI